MEAVATADLGLRVRRARERLNMSQAQLAAAINRSVRAVGSWERGESVPRNAIGALEHVLHIDLTGGEPPDPNEEILMSLDLDPPERDKVIEAYRAILAAGGRARRTG